MINLNQTYANTYNFIRINKKLSQKTLFFIFFHHKFQDLFIIF